MKYRNQKITLIKVLAVAAFVLSPTTLFAANTLTNGVTVTRIDSTTYNGNIRIQTEPRADIGGLACSSNFWLVLRADSANYRPLLASLLTAKAGGLTASVGADDTNLTGGFCEFSRFVLD